MNAIYAIAAAALVAIGIAAGASVQGLRLDAARAELGSVRSELASVRSDLDVANQRIERQAQQADAVQRSLASERTRAVAAERQAADLKEQIARDTGTARDGETAPVLKDAVKGLQRTGMVNDRSNAICAYCRHGAASSGRVRMLAISSIVKFDASVASGYPQADLNLSVVDPDNVTALYNGRRPDRHRLAVVIHGQVDRIESFAEPAAYIARALAVGAEVLSYRSYPRLRGSVLVSCAPIRPERAA